MLRVLGEVEACVGGQAVDLGHPKQRCVLAVLVVARGLPVPVDVLVERVWGEDAPPRGRETVHSHLSRLRRALGGVRITRQSGGYALDPGQSTVDLYLFRDACVTASGETNDATVVTRLSEALALWRGRALAGLSGEWAEAERAHLDRERLAARVELAEARLRLGESARLVPELETLADEHPYDERLARLCMAALHRAGRTAEALAHYRRIRARLADDIGVEPSRQLAELHGELLGASAAVPRQLPAAIRDFTGRVEHLAELDALLPSASAGQAVVISALDGSGGVGKSTLAVHWAHRVQHLFPDGTLHTNLRGYGPGEPASPDEALDDFLVALGVPATAVPAGTGARSGLLRTLLTGRQVLLVLDNARSAEQVRPLLPGAPGCMALVTSRDSLAGLVVTEAAHRLTLDVLSPDEGLRLVTGILGAARAGAEPAAVWNLVELCARLPLALRIAAGRVAAQRHLRVADVVAELAGGDRSRLDALVWGQDPYAAVRTVLDWSYERLPVPQALLFRRLGLHPGPEASLPAAAALVGLPPQETHALLAALVDANLITPVSRDRYRFHDLLRAYAAEQARAVDGDGREALAALLTWYRHTAHRADRLVYPTSTRLAAEAPCPPHPHTLADRDAAWAWFVAERANLVAALHHAVDAGLDEHAVHLVDAFGFLILLGGWEERITTADVALVAARRAGALAHEANVLLARGEALVHLDRPEAEGDLSRAAELAQRAGTTYVRVAALNELGRLLLNQGRHAEALQRLEIAHALARGVDTGRWEAIVDGTLAFVHAGLGDHRKAIEHSERSARLRHDIGDSDGEACAITALAKAWQGLGEHDRAMAHCRRAIELGRASLGSQDETLAAPLTVLAASLHHAGRVGEALTCWREAAAIYAERGLDTDAAEVRARLRTATATPARRAGERGSAGRRFSAYGRSNP